MSEGLRPHRHCYFEVESKRYFDKNRGCAIRKTHYECMICGHEFYEIVELSHDPPQYKNKNNVLNRNRNRGQTQALFILPWTWHLKGLKIHPA